MLPWALLRPGLSVWVPLCMGRADVGWPVCLVDCMTSMPLVNYKL